MTEEFPDNPNHPAFDLGRLPGSVIRDGGGYDLELAKQSVGQGWHPLLERLFAALPSGVQVVQVKEKFGGLRFYTADGPTRVDIMGVGSFSIPLTEDEATPRLSVEEAEARRNYHALIEEMEGESLQTCEACGAPGQQRGGGWIRTLCDGCYAVSKSRASEYEDPEE